MSCSRSGILLEVLPSRRSHFNMSDPLFDALLASDPYTATALPAPLQPSRAATPLGTHSITSTIPPRSSTSSNPTKDIEAERRADEAEALFDPLQGKQHSSRAHELISLLYFPSYTPWSFADSTRSQVRRTSASILSCKRSYDAHSMLMHPEDVPYLYKQKPHL